MALTWEGAGVRNDSGVKRKIAPEVILAWGKMMGLEKMPMRGITLESGKEQVFHGLICVYQQRDSTSCRLFPLKLRDPKKQVRDERRCVLGG